MATKDEIAAVVTDVVRRELGRSVWETTAALPNRRGPGGAELQNGGADTAFGYSINADGFGYRIEQIVTDIHRYLAAGGKAPAGSALSDTDVQRVAAAVVSLLGRQLAT